MDNQVAVVYCRFQVLTLKDKDTPYGIITKMLVDELTSVDKRYFGLFEHLLKTYRTVVAALVVRRHGTSSQSPFDFKVRQGVLNSRFVNLRVIPIEERKYLDDQVKTLDAGIDAVISGMTVKPAKVFLCDIGEIPRDFILYYNECGSYNFLTDEPLRPQVTLDIRPQFNRDFLLGIQYAYQSQYPREIPTVDLAIVSEGKLLLGRKPNERNFRFLGGYKDRADKSLEEAALREAQEETNSTELTYPRYIGSANIDDWRYRGEKDGIITTFFYTELYGDRSTVKAGDDIEEVKWFDIEDLPSVEQEHVVLKDMFIKFMEELKS